MARGELMKKLLASYSRDDEFRAVAEQIIDKRKRRTIACWPAACRQTLEKWPKPAERAKGAGAAHSIPGSGGGFY